MNISDKPEYDNRKGKRSCHVIFCICTPEEVGRTGTSGKHGKECFPSTIKDHTRNEIDHHHRECETDTEHAEFANKLTFPFSSHILTPSCYIGEVGEKQIRYNGYHELAYLHPNWFTPNPAVLTELGLTEDIPFCIVRFVSWSASHDVGQCGIQDKIHLVSSLKKIGRVLITSEDALPPDLERYKIQISPEKLHDLLYYATIYIGEGATTASECAVIGTHALYINTLRLGYTNEEDIKYHLVCNFSRTDEIKGGVLDKAKELLNDPELRAKGRLNRLKLLKDKIDVTAFMVRFIENYSESFLRR